MYFISTTTTTMFMAISFIQFIHILSVVLYTQLIVLIHTHTPATFIVVCIKYSSSSSSGLNYETTYVDSPAHSTLFFFCIYLVSFNNSFAPFHHLRLLIIINVYICIYMCVMDLKRGC